MNSNEDIKLYIDDKYTKFLNNLTKEVIMREALYISNKSCFICVKKKHKLLAFHKLMKEFIYKLHHEICSKSPLNVPTAIPTNSNFSSMKKLSI